MLLAFLERQGKKDLIFSSILSILQLNQLSKCLIENEKYSEALHMKKTYARIYQEAAQRQNLVWEDGVTENGQ